MDECLQNICNNQQPVQFSVHLPPRTRRISVCQELSVYVSAWLEQGKKKILNLSQESHSKIHKQQTVLITDEKYPIDILYSTPQQFSNCNTFAKREIFKVYTIMCSFTSGLVCCFLFVFYFSREKLKTRLSDSLILQKETVDGE